jgi:Methyltransferase FkbM domain
MIQWYLNDLVKNETNVVLIPKAASTYNGKATFFVTAGQEQLGKDQMPNGNCDPMSKYNPGGASTLFGSAKRASTILNYTVDAVDFLQWHQDLRLQDGDTVHMKMDIEGAEFGIIDKFLNDDPTNQICYWDVFWIEYHKSIFGVNTTEYTLHETLQNEFPARFIDKCGKRLWPNVPV